MLTPGSISACHKVEVQYSFLVVEAKATLQHPTVRGPSQNRSQAAMVSRIAGNQWTQHSVLLPRPLTLHWKEPCHSQAVEEARNGSVPSSDPLHTDAELKDATMGPKGAVLSRAQHSLAQHKLPKVGRMSKKKINSMENTFCQHSMGFVLTRVLPP